MTNQSSGNDSYTMSAAGSYAGSSYSLSSYVFQGNSMGSSSASDASRESSSSGSSSQGRSQSGQESDSLYQAGSQGCFGGYSNASYAYQDTARSTVSNAASGPSYASSDSAGCRRATSWRWPRVRRRSRRERPTVTRRARGAGPGATARRRRRATAVPVRWCSLPVQTSVWCRRMPRGIRRRGARRWWRRTYRCSR